MICLLCLEDWKNPDEYFNITEELNFNKLEIISKHFWIKPRIDLPSKCVCNICWYHVESFHLFYSKIEEAHLSLTQHQSVKVEPAEQTDNEDIKENVCADQASSVVTVSKKRGRKPKVSKTQKESTIKKEKFEEENYDDENDEIKEEEGSDSEQNTPSESADGALNFDDANSEDEQPKEKKKRVRGLKVDEADEKIANYLQLKCDICSQQAQTLALLKAHYRDAHDKKGYAVCCNKKFYKRYLLVDHIEVHLNPEYFKCSYCQKIFSVADCLKKHVKDAHETEKVEYFCDQCPKKFIRQMLLDRHKAYHRPIDEWTDVCTIENCTKIFPSKFYLRSHIIFTHNKLPHKMCHICGQSLPSNKYKKHLREHEGIPEPKVQCDICGAWLIKKYLATHKVNHEEATMTHTCTKCGKISPNRRALYIHMRYTHAEVRKFECSFCQKTFKRRLALKQHIGIHTGENLYKCPYCPKTFTYDSNFHNHKKKDHPLEHAEEKKRKPRTDFVKCVEIQEQQQEQQQMIQNQVAAGQLPPSLLIKFELDNRSND